MMKPLPDIKESWSDLLDQVMAIVPSDILTTAVKLKVFDAMEQPAAAADIAGRLGFHARNTGLFLNALVGLEIITKRNGLFVNTAKSAEFLVSSSPAYLGSFFLHYRQWQEDLGTKLEGLVKQGPAETNETDMVDGSVWAHSAQMSAAYQYTGVAQGVSRIVASQPEFSNMRKMLDLGGGSGFFTQAIVASHPSLTGVIFEQPPVAAVAREFLRQYGAEDRVTVKEGDYTTDSLGSGYDLVFASATLNFHKEQIDRLVAKIYETLNPGGLFISHQDGCYAERTKPYKHIIAFLTVELNGMDFAIPRGLIADSMLKAGFQTVRSFTTQSDVGEMDIDIARKSS